MANIKSAKKRIKVTLKKTLRNKIIKSRTKTAIKKVVLAIKSADKELSRAAFINASKIIDKATSKGIYHKNNAARKKSKLAKMINKIA